MPLQWRNQIWQSLEESAKKRCSERALDRHPVIGLGDFPSVFLFSNIFFSFLPGVDALHVYVGAWALDCFYSHISTRTFRRALTASVDSCAEIKSAPSVA